MAKDDYHVIVYRLLSYLYDCLKHGKDPDMKILDEVLKDIPESYKRFILKTLKSEGYTKNYKFEPVGDDEWIIGLENICITVKGTEYLTDVSFMQKVHRFMKGVKDVIPGI